MYCIIPAKFFITSLLQSVQFKSLAIKTAIMYIKVRKLGEKAKNDLLINISKKAKIEELRQIIFKELGVDVEKQCLLYKGKQLINDHCLMEYDVQLNDVIQLMVKTDIQGSNNEEQTRSDLANKKEEIDAESQYYLLGDLLDMRDIHGAWFEGKIVKITKMQSNEAEESELIFKVIHQNETERSPFDLKFNDIRPRSYFKYSISDLSNDMLVLVNYNIDEPKSRGYWYDFKITEVTDKSVAGTILFGTDKTPIDNCSIAFANEIYRIEPPALLTDRNYDEDKLKQLPMRKVPYNCLKCKDVASRKCKACGCRICGGKENWDKILLCDECDFGYHTYCLTPPLEQVPTDDDWYCSDCKTDENEIVKAGDKLKFSKKKAKMPSASDQSNSRDWGRGMACIGRTKECTIVSKNHIGPVPGVEVGTCWKFRFQVSEAGIHRPMVAGIHGRESNYAYSIVLSGGYEDDIDNGDEFYYTGSGGRDLSGNKRVSEQSCDQVLTRMNKALAMNCNAKFDSKNGAEAENWKGGKPVRVVRNYKLAKHSKYAPKDGNRYDGVYKVVKYYPEKGKSGFVVWRYLLRRDDPHPAPWDKEGKELDMIYPPGYLEAQASKEKEKVKNAKSPDNKRGSKRILSDKSNEPHPFFKKIKPEEFKLEDAIQSRIEGDGENRKLWDDCKYCLREGKSKFLNKVEELFMCICCQEIVYLPITTECKHNICKSCLKRSFSSEIYSCPCCRFALGKDFKFTINENLDWILKKLFPGYEAAR